MSKCLLCEAFIDNISFIHIMAEFCQVFEEQKIFTGDPFMGLTILVNYFIIFGKSCTEYD